MSVPAGVDDGTDTGIVTVREAPLASAAASVQVIVDVPEQPAGSVPTTTPDGGAYVNVIGPAASEGPLSVAVSVTVPDVPAAIEGEVTAKARSATRAPAVTVVGVTVLSAGAGSAEPVDTEAEPPVSAPGAVDDGIDTGIVTVRVAPLASVAAEVQVIVDVPEQPAGSVPTTTPEGGV